MDEFAKIGDRDDLSRVAGKEDEVRSSSVVGEMCVMG